MTDEPNHPLRRYAADHAALKVAIQAFATSEAPPPLDVRTPSLSLARIVEAERHPASHSVARTGL
jgi:hypothetical protein